jgi:hypothetical protein
MRRTLAVVAVLLVAVLVAEAPNAVASTAGRYRVMHGGPSHRFETTVVRIRAPHHGWRFRLTLHCANPRAAENAFMAGAGTIRLERTDETGGVDGFTFGSVGHRIAWHEHVGAGRWWLRIYTGCRWTLKVSRKGVKPLRRGRETTV